MTDINLASYANLAVYSAMAVLALSMIGYAVYLARWIPSRRAVEVAREPEVVVVGGPAVSGRGGADGGGAAQGSGLTGGAIDCGWGELIPAPEPPLATKAAGIARALAGLAALLLIAAVVMRGWSVHRAPLGNMYEFALVGSMFVLVGYLAWASRRDLRWLGLFVVTPILLVLGLGIAVWYTDAGELMPSLKSYWLVIHVSVATVAVAAFTIAFALSVLYLVRDRFVAARRRSFMDRMPDAPALERLSYSAHIVAFPLWTFSVIAGAIWARQAWGAYWNWDPKEVWSFVIWVVYAAYLHARATSGWSRRSATWIAVAGFVCIILNFTVVNFFFVGQHSYSGVG